MSSSIKDIGEFWTPKWKGVFSFRATTIAKAFFINSVVLGVTVALTSIVGSLFTDDKFTFWKVLPQILTAMATAWLTYMTFHFFIGSGGGMLAASN
jgi:hypothetical protein